ncbi:MAG: hypothetical protein EBU84_10680 [Actinobacteria bacterium]|jgi:hypothetical protein|nr:hypothetical protein [Actinomycetota bacterium]
MANNSAQYAFFVGFNYSELPAEEREEVDEGIRYGYLRLEPGTRIIRAIPQEDPNKPTHNGKYNP